MIIIVFPKLSSPKVNKVTVGKILLKVTSSRVMELFLGPRFVCLVIVDVQPGARGWCGTHSCQSFHTTLWSRGGGNTPRHAAMRQQRLGRHTTMFGWEVSQIHHVYYVTPDETEEFTFILWQEGQPCPLIWRVQMSSSTVIRSGCSGLWKAEQTERRQAAEWGSIVWASEVEERWASLASLTLFTVSPRCWVWPVSFHCYIAS